MDDAESHRALDLAFRLVIEADRAGIRRERSVGAILSALADHDPQALLDAVADARVRLQLASPQAHPAGP